MTLLVVKCIRDTLLYRKSGTVLDVGSGNGRNAIFLAQKGFSVTAIDSDPHKMAALRSLATHKNLSIITSIGDARNLEDFGSFDIVLATNILHFLNKEEIPPAIHAIQKHTENGGLNVISVHTDKNPSESRPYLFKEDELRNYYANWTILSYEEVLGKAFPDKQGNLVRKYRATLIAQKP